jgi:hypothetical protein
MLYLEISENDFWNKIPVETQQGINKAKGELDRGEGIPHAEIMSEIKAQFLNGLV